MTTPQFANVDTKKPDGFYIQFERVEIPDETAGLPDEMDDGFWPSQDSKAAGYVAPDLFRSEMNKAERRMAEYERGGWGFIGVRARALCMIVRNGVGTLLNVESPGLWGIESDSGADYLAEVFEAEKADLLTMFEVMKSPIIEAA